MQHRKAFTLIELLTVIAVIGILASITIGVSAGISQRKARTVATAELAGISAALETYRNEFGAYPEVNLEESSEERGRQLFLALANRRRAALDSPILTEDRRPFIDLGKFQIVGEDSSEPVDPGESSFDPSSGEYYLMDPWGNPYEYGYESDPGQVNWKRFGYLLFSTGADGEPAEIPTGGLPDETLESNGDNIYPGN